MVGGVSRSTNKKDHGLRSSIPHTLEGEAWNKLGELRRLSAGDISDNGRGKLPEVFVGEDLGVLLPFAMCSGCT